MLGVCLRKLCPQDSFGYAFRKKEAVRKWTPGGSNSGPWRVQNGLRELFCASWAQLRRQGRSEAVFGSGGALGSWGSFWDLPEADLDDLDDVCGAT